MPLWASTRIKNQVAKRYFTLVRPDCDDEVLATTNAYTQKDAKEKFERILGRKIKLSEIDRE